MPVACPACGTSYPDGATTCSVDGSLLERRTVPLVQSADPDSWEATVRRDLLVGRSVGAYQIEGRIGAGGMGIVYSARHPAIGRRVAIKILNPQLAENGYALQKEAMAASAIHHHGIINVFDFGELPGIGPYMVMDLLEGRSLEQEISASAPMRANEVIAILDEALAALSAAHQARIVHRDFKPSNVFLVTESGGARVVKLLDFGLAKGVAPLDPRFKTQTGMILGTPAYMAPEQVKGERVDARSDLYSVGVVAFEMLTGRVPFGGQSALEVAMHHVATAPPRPSELARGVFRPLEELVLQLLAKEPAQRPTSAETVRAELRAIGRALASERTDPRGDPQQSRPPAASELAAGLPDTTATALARPRKRGALALAAVGAVAAVSLLAWFFAAQPDPPAKSRDAPVHPERSRGTVATVPESSAAPVAPGPTPVAQVPEPEVPDPPPSPAATKRATSTRSRPDSVLGAPRSSGTGTLRVGIFQVEGVISVDGKCYFPTEAPRFRLGMKAFFHVSPLRAGRHRLRVESELGTHEQDVEVVAGEVTKVGFGPAMLQAGGTLKCLRTR